MMGKGEETYTGEYTLLAIQTTRPPIFGIRCALDDLYPVTYVEVQIPIRLDNHIKNKND